MRVKKTPLDGVMVIEPDVFPDERGFFKVAYHAEQYAQQGIRQTFVQDNQSRSKRGTLRGLHFQRHHPQAKLVTVLSGTVFDVAVDVRRSSPGFGRSFGVELSDANHLQLYIPEGFAHGFCVLSETADIFYKCSDLYFPQHERTLMWNDPAVGIHWPLPQDVPLILSAKDQQGAPLAELDAFE